MSKQLDKYGKSKKGNFFVQDTIGVPHNYVPEEEQIIEGCGIFDDVRMPPLPADYEACGVCGFDHAYEPEEAKRSHSTTKE